MLPKLNSLVTDHYRRSDKRIFHSQKDDLHQSVNFATTAMFIIANEEQNNGVTVKLNMTPQILALALVCVQHK